MKKSLSHFTSFFAFFFTFFLIAICMAAQAVPDIQTAQGRSHERERISQERAALEKKFNAADVECQKRFVVTSCRDEVKVQRTRAMDELTRQENILNTLERKEAAAKQQKKLDDNISAASLAEKERKRQEALDKTAKRAIDREDKQLDRERKAETNEASNKAEVKDDRKSQSLSEQEKAAKRAAYAAKQEELAKRLKRREEGLSDLAEKKKEREREEARKAEKYAKALEAEAKAKAAKQ